MFQLLPRLMALAIVVASGLVQGYWTNRWNTTAELEDAAVRLERVPLTIGEWQGSPAEYDQRVVRRFGFAGLLSRRYVNQKTGEEMAALVVCGRPGPIAAHGPEICYAGEGYEAVAPAVKRGVGSHGFWMCDFQKPEIAGLRCLRVYWSWSSTGEWVAAESPRLMFARSPVLYKLYLIRDTTLSRDHVQDATCMEFAGEFLRESRSLLFPAL